MVSLPTPEISLLTSQTLGNPQICIAVLDGLVDLEHACFQGANLTQLPTLVTGTVKPDGEMSLHGSHVASIIFGQPNSPVTGIAPACKGLIVPVFSDDRSNLSQLDLARAIETAVSAGAHIINISGGQLTEIGEAEGWLESAVQLCTDNNVLIVAAAGNDGCNCLHVPAALPAVLAVGAMDDRGWPCEIWDKRRTIGPSILPLPTPSKLPPPLQKRLLGVWNSTALKWKKALSAVSIATVGM